MSAPAPSAAPLDLSMLEAVELSTAWLQETAEARSVRILVLKGATLERQGLREHRVSSDVDVLVEPSRVDDFERSIVEAGWEEFAETFTSKHFVTHSHTFRKPGWPNSIDVHAFWPGFLAPADEVFDRLWQRRVTVDFAHRACVAPDRNANLLMLALHSLRGSAADPRHESELAGLRRIALADSDRSDLAALATQTGSAAPLRALLAELGVVVAIDPDELGTPLYREWHRKVAHAQGRTASWLIELRRAPWTRKAIVLRHGVWPTDHDLLAEHPDVPDRFWAKIRARIVRLGGGIRQLPRVIPALRGK